MWQGLQTWSRWGGDVTVSNHKNLEVLDNRLFPNLAFAGGKYVIVEFNSKLTNMSNYLPSLENSTGKVYIYGDTTLVTMANVCKSLVTAGGVEINNAGITALDSTTGFGNLATSTGTIQIQNNNELLSINSVFPALTAVASTIAINNNDKLHTVGPARFGASSSPMTLANQLYVAQNKVLADVIGFLGLGCTAPDKCRMNWFGNDELERSDVCGVWDSMSVTGTGPKGTPSYGTSNVAANCGTTAAADPTTTTTTTPAASNTIAVGCGGQMAGSFVLPDAQTCQTAAGLLNTLFEASDDNPVECYNDLRKGGGSSSGGKDCNGQGCHLLGSYFFPRPIPYVESEWGKAREQCVRVAERLNSLLFSDSHVLMKCGHDSIFFKSVNTGTLFFVYATPLSAANGDSDGGAESCASAVLLLNAKLAARQAITSNTPTSSTAPSPKIYVTGGSTGSHRTQTLNGVSTAWKKAPDMTTGRTYHAMAVFRGLLFALGGVGPRRSVESFDGVQWSTAPSMINARFNAGVAVYKSALYVTGGKASADAENGGATQKPVRWVERFDGTEWVEAPEMTTERYAHVSVAYQGQLYAIGGTRTDSDGSHNPLATVERFDGDSWSAAPSMITARGAAAGAVFQGSIYITGGETPSYATSVERFDGIRWSEASEMSQNRAHHAAVVFDSLLYAIAGDMTNYGTGNAPVYNRDSVETFNGTAWVDAPPLITAAGNMLAAAVFPQEPDTTTTPATTTATTITTTTTTTTTSLICVCADGHVATADRLGCTSNSTTSTTSETATSTTTTTTSNQTEAPQRSNTGPQCPPMEYRVPRSTSNNGTECRRGYQCKSTPGTILHVALVSDGFPDCADGLDESEEAAAAKDLYVNETLGGIPPELPELTEEQEDLLEAVVEIATSELPDIVALVGKSAALLIIVTVIALSLIMATVVAEQMAESSRLDAKSGKAGAAPCWMASSWKAALAKIWHCFWEFKAAPIIVYSFYAMLLSVSEIATTQQLSPVCLPDPATPRWDTERQCNLDEPSCAYVEKDLGPSICHRSLRETGRSRLLHHMQGLTEQINSGNGAEVPKCGCLIPGEAGLDGLVEGIVLPCTIVLALGLVAAVVVAIYASKLWRFNFGTLEYFLTVADCRRVGLYTSLLIINVAVVLISFFAIVKQVEFDRRGGNLTQKQYDDVYVALFVGYLLQFLAFGNLWSHRPPSTALKKFMKKCKLEAVGSSLITPTDVATVELKWLWYLTADDVLANAENGFLFYTFSKLERLEAPHGIDDAKIDYENWVPSEKDAGQQQSESKIAAWTKSATSCTVPDVPKLKKVHHQEQQPGNFEQRYLAQKLGMSYWTGGLAVSFVSANGEKPKSTNPTIAPAVKDGPTASKKNHASVSIQETNFTQNESGTDSASNAEGYLSVENSAEETFPGFGPESSRSAVANETYGNNTPEGAVYDEASNSAAAGQGVLYDAVSASGQAMYSLAQNDAGQQQQQQQSQALYDEASTGASYNLSGAVDGNAGVEL